MKNQTSITAEHQKSQFASDPLIVDTAIAQGVTSVSTVDELPESMKYLEPMLPGILFMHHPPDGDPVPQFRPDRPKNDSAKYLFPKGGSSVLSLNPNADFSKPKVAIVEGTKQAIFATTYAPDDTLIVGIQGCWGWSSEGQALGSLDEIVKGHDVIVIFDADVNSNPDVYAAGASLYETLNIIGAKSVTFASIPGGKTVGLDDFLARRPAADRASVFAQMLSQSTPFSKVKKPVKRKVSVDAKDATFDYVSEILGEICAVEFEKIDDDGTVPREQEGRPVAGIVDGRNVRRVETLLHAAVTIDTVVSNRDDLTLGAETSISYDLKLQIGQEDDCKTYEIKDVPSYALGNVRRWLDRAGVAGSLVEFGRYGLGISGGLRIENAIRADADFANVNQRISRPHSGWFEYEDDVMWSDTGGSHSDTRKRTDVVSNLQGSFSALNIPGWFENYQKPHLFASLDELFKVEQYLIDPTAWIAGISAISWALAGGDPDAVMYILGGEGSGKSSIAGLLSSFFSNAWGTGLNPMSSADGTSASLRDLTKQPHNMFLVVDDVRGRSSSRAQDTQADGLESLIRPGYAGGGAGMTKKVRNATGDWIQEQPKSNRFFLCIVGEILPDAERQSSIERCLVVEIDRETSLRAAGKDTPDGRSGFEYISQLSRDHTMLPITSAFLASMAGTIEANGGLNRWRSILNDTRTTLTADAVSKRIPSAPKRVINVTGTFISGATLFLEWLKDVDYIDEKQFKELESHWQDLIIEAAQRHAVTNLNPGGESELIISQAVGAVASGRYCIGPATQGQTRLGVATVAGGVDCIALIPGILAIICYKSEAEILGRLRDVVVRDGEGKLAKLVSIDNVKVRCAVIPKPLWESSEFSEDDLLPPEVSSDDHL